MILNGFLLSKFDVVSHFFGADHIFGKRALVIPIQIWS